ncbi:MAG: NUDIX hydrolase [Acidimicrobiales bacterium]|nr:NUDIX hydrolase [Acidimicrobiales bacterium]
MDDRIPFEPDQAEVRAAGGVVWRRGDGGVRVLLVHRPHRQDWSIPKGRVDPGETIEQTARREVLEETGLDCDLGQYLGHISYWDHKERSKTVWYWAMESPSGDPVVNDEVDEFTWMDIAAAAQHVDYDNDREVLGRFVGVLDRLDS